MLRTMMGLVLTAMAVAALPAARAQTLTIQRGETVTVTIADDGAATVADRAPAQPNNYEIAGTAEFQRGDYNAAIGANTIAGGRTGAGALAPTPEPGKLVLRFVRTPNKNQSMLSIQNGYDRGFVYRATMRIAGTSRPTDVCLVVPGRVANEYWPDPIDALELSDFQLVPWQPGDPVKCA